MYIRIYVLRLNIKHHPIQVAAGTFTYSEHAPRVYTCKEGRSGSRPARVQSESESEEGGCGWGAGAGAAGAAAGGGSRATASAYAGAD